MKKLFLIDDDDTFQYTFLRSCKKLEAISSVITASNGQEGLDKLKDGLASGNLPDFIFVDINMPVMNGFEFLAEYKELKMNNPDKMGNIALIAMLTSSVNEEDKERAMKSGVVNRYLLKPDDMQKTKEMLSNLLSSLINT